MVETKLLLGKDGKEQRGKACSEAVREKGLTHWAHCVSVRIRGRPQNRFMDVVKAGIQSVGETQENAMDSVRWSQTT